MKPTRSLLFVPGHRKGWAEKAVVAGADAVILDLEDSVPFDMKAETRHMVAETIRDLAKNHPKVSVYVRLNALETGMMGDDLEVVAIEGCDGFLPPKTYGARDVVSADALVTHFERRNGVDPWKAGVRAVAGDGAGLCRLREHDQGLAPLRHAVRGHGARCRCVSLGRVRIHARGT